MSYAFAAIANNYFEKVGIGRGIFKIIPKYLFQDKLRKTTSDRRYLGSDLSQGPPQYEQ
jgi:hypothetical protein